jgi:energy-coupling factor transporter transmembrane protein EcfT
LNFVTHGQIVVPFGTWFGHRAGLTRQGLDAGGLIVARVAVSISLVVLLTLSTRWHQLLGALRALFVPRLFIMVLAMSYRYVFVLLNCVTDMYTARTARTVNHDGDAATGRAFVAATGGALFGKAHALSEEVHQAMVSRGYTGDSRVLRQVKTRGVDVLWSVTCATAAIATLGADHVLGR